MGGVGASPKSKGGGSKSAGDVEAGPAAKHEKPTSAANAKRSAEFRYPAKPSWLKRILFIDVDPLIALGFRTRLEPEHMCPDPSVATQRLYNNLEPAWREQQAKEKPDLKRALLRGNMGTLLLTAVLYLVAQACSLAGPLLLREIVTGLQCEAAQRRVPVDIGCKPRRELYYYIIGLFLAPAIQSLCENQNNFLLYSIGTRMRNSLMAAIYRKCLRLSNSALQAESTGKVVTLMSNDAQKLQDAMFAIHAIWGSPAYIVAVLVLLWFEVGWATFVGLGVMLALVPATGMLAARLGMLRREIMKWTDKRVGRMNELINGIQMVKFYAWEPAFRSAVMENRQQEANILRRLAFWQGIFGLLLFYGPVAVALFTFGSFAIAGQNLTPAKAYTALALFSLLRFPMSFLPMLVTMIVNAMVAIKRIQGFLMRDEASLEKWDQDKTPVGAVAIRDGCFTWDTTAEKPTLQDINLDARPGSLTMIVGGVGSGKSSMLNALIGHITRKGGEVEVGGRIAYVAQSAWIMNDTLQENVLLGAPLDPERYRSALEAAQLGPDLAILPNGDLTEIGDRGITLSGGQKQRVSIARAVYADADVYLLDDPLSAVDSHVGRALFEQAIRGVLRSKTIVLVTNALQYLPHADTILWMEDGQVRAQGSYNQLLEAGLNIAELCHDEAEDAEDAAKGDPAATKGDPKPTSKRDSTEQGKDQQTDAAKPPATATVTAANGHHHKGAGGVPPGVGAGAGSVTAGGGKGGDVQPLPAFIVQGKLTMTRQAADTNRNLTGIETREAGAISGTVIKAYFKAGGGWIYFVPLVALFAVEQGARVYTDTWVGNWFGDKYDRTTAFYLGIYFMLGVVYGLMTLARSTTFLFFCVRASLHIHNTLLDHILALPKSFFDTNPSGRILNRFSRDTDIMDTTLSASLIQFAGAVCTYISILVVITIATKWFGIALVPLTIIYFTIQRYYIPSARELQRIESISRSPIYSRFGEALAGVSTIRAYRLESHFVGVSDGLMERNAHAFITQKLAAGWLAMRLDILGLGVLTLAGALCIQGGIDPGMAGLALTYALDLTRFLKHGTNMASKSEADFNSVERIVQYLEPEPEAAPETAPEVAKTMPKEWPSAGAIEVQDLHMRYRPNMPLVLCGISFRVEPGHKIGLVGRTGSGKSSLLLALFRMVEAEAGRILIDGVDIATLGVRHLRSKMSIIPQDPFMFSGSVRHNLDPFHTATDDELWRALDSVGLSPAISGLEEKLEAKVVDGGANFSLGQRQLFCLARAMLRKSRVLMLDEATASVDVDTDNHIQGALRQQFGDVTCLTIAHRLNTIMDADRVIVLDAGRVVEAEEPVKLLERQQSIFKGMVDQTGRSSARYLTQLARSASLARSDSTASGAKGPLVLPYDRSKSVFGTNASFAGRNKSRLGSLPGRLSSLDPLGRYPEDPYAEEDEEEGQTGKAGDGASGSGSGSGSGTPLIGGVAALQDETPRGVPDVKVSMGDTETEVETEVDSEGAAGGSFGTGKTSSGSHSGGSGDDNAVVSPEAVLPHVGVTPVAGGAEESKSSSSSSK